ncbi:protein FAM104A-like isoform X1 [Alosa sapidissima]|uniref:protein FAM104A-like isoform X1 n=1 Tax=Alosa sapidissima TaxID=34773 RepID=UPI001C0904EC|nr:protein FAM104A-like isoform X1 [Alosa sapidissima]XP_041938023.1 protein FAM104A-like isoform X1 [Alosa sapidissima]XP_041938024.1 protein FAM104A-like isoform X1 [Alosa sapidissima]
MLTESRKRRRSSDSEGGQVLPQAKRPGGGNALLPDLGRDAWDSESSSSDSSGISSPERLAGASGGSSSSSSSLGSMKAFGADGSGRGNYITQAPCSPATSSNPGDEPLHAMSYHDINRVLREAHFASLRTRSHPGAT